MPNSINQMAIRSGRMYNEDGEVENIITIASEIRDKLTSSTTIKTGVKFEKMIQQQFLKGNIYKSSDKQVFTDNKEQYFLIETGAKPIAILKGNWEGSSPSWNFQLIENPSIESNGGVTTQYNGFNKNRARVNVSQTNTYLNPVVAATQDNAIEIDHAIITGEVWDTSDKQASMNAPYMFLAENSQYLVKMTCNADDYASQSGTFSFIYLEEDIDTLLALFE